jgi:hypothetical protein
MGTESKVPFNLLTTPRAPPIGLFLERTGLDSACLIENSTATIALQKALSPFDRDEGNKKQADIVVQPLEACRGQAAVGADPRLIIHLYSSGLNSADENEGPSPPLHEKMHRA